MKHLNAFILTLMGQNSTSTNNPVQESCVKIIYVHSSKCPAHGPYFSKYNYDTEPFVNLFTKKNERYIINRVSLPVIKMSYLDSVFKDEITINNIFQKRVDINLFQNFENIIENVVNNEYYDKKLFDHRNCGYFLGMHCELTKCYIRIILMCKDLTENKKKIEKTAKFLYFLSDRLDTLYLNADFNTKNHTTESEYENNYISPDIDGINKSLYEFLETENELLQEELTRIEAYALLLGWTSE